MPYSFDLLIKQPIPSHIDTHELFFKMLRVVQQPEHEFSIISLKELPHVLSQDMYYVAHHLVAYKGKQPLFKGTVVQALQADLLDFISKSIALDDLRNMLICPVFDDNPQYVIYVDEGLFYLYSIQ